MQISFSFYKNEKASDLLAICCFLSEWRRVILTLDNILPTFFSKLDEMSSNRIVLAGIGKKICYHAILRSTLPRVL